jgi:hypothetical protein
MTPGGRWSEWLGRAAIFLPLLAILIAAVWFAVDMWLTIEGPDMPVHGYVALAAGAILSLAVGIGLMSLLFYSRRHGYDERVQQDRWDHRE